MSNEAAECQNRIYEAITELIEEHGWSKADVRKEVEAILNDRK